MPDPLMDSIWLDSILSKDGYDHDNDLNVEKKNTQFVQFLLRVQIFSIN